MNWLWFVLGVNVGLALALFLLVVGAAYGIKLALDGREAGA